MPKYDIVPPHQDDPMNECLDCHHEGREYGEIDMGIDDCAEVVCPKCGSINYYIKEIENAQG